MPRINISSKDILRGKLVPPARYQLLVDSLEVRAASTDGSDYFAFTLVIENHKEFNGVPINFGASEKLILTPMIELLSACGWKGKEGVTELNDCVGKRVEGFVQRGTHYKTGAPENQLVSFSPIKQSTS